MTTRRQPQAVALVLALVLTLAIFSGVSGLAAPEHAGPMLAKAVQTAPARV